MKPREAGSRSQAAPSQAPHRRHPLRSPLDLLKRRKKLLVVSVLLTAALAAYSGYLHAVWPKCSPAGELGDVGATKAQHEAVEGAFVYLVGPDKGEELGGSLDELYRNVLAEHPRPVILFYGDDVGAEELERTVAGLSAPLRELVEVIVLEDFLQLPAHMRGVDIVNEAGKVDHAWVDMYPGYQNMCRWNFMQLVIHPRIRALDYYCRLDTHSVVRSPMGHDVFEFMAARGLKYGFVDAEEEPAHVIKGLWDFTEAYFNNASAAAYPPASRALAMKNGVLQRIPPPAERDQMTYFYNNFEVLEVQHFSSPPVTAFNEAVDASHNIYRHRWGDGPLRWIQCLLFLDLAREVHQFADFEYAHYDDVFNRKIVCRNCASARVVG